MKLLSITWSDTDEYDLKATPLYKSFIKHNNEKNLFHIHFNRNEYKDLESNYNNKYAYQSEFILYKILLTYNFLLKTNDIEDFIYADTNDVVVLDNIDKVVAPKKILFSCEKHQYPKNATWLSQKNYSNENITQNIFLNSGLFVTNKTFFTNFLHNCILNILPHEFKDYGGDQGIYTYYYINLNENKDITLDVETKYFLSTYLRSPDMFTFSDNKFINKEYNTSPLFVHDNGWNYGSPKFRERFNLL